VLRNYQLSLKSLQRINGLNSLIDNLSAQDIISGLVSIWEVLSSIYHRIQSHNHAPDIKPGQTRIIEIPGPVPHPGSGSGSGSIYQPGSVPGPGPGPKSQPRSVPYPGPGPKSQLGTGPISQPGSVPHSGPGPIYLPGSVSQPRPVPQPGPVSKPGLIPQSRPVLYHKTIPEPLFRSGMKPESIPPVPPDIDQGFNSAPIRFGLFHYFFMG
jgi:hypothetical protein